MPHAAPTAKRPPKRILHVEANEDGTIGGSHRALADLVRAVDHERYTPVILFYQHNPHVAALRDQGVEVHVFDQERAFEREVRGQGGLRKFADYFGAIARRRRFLRAQRVDLVHLNNSPRVGYDDWLPAAKLAGIPCIAFAMGDANFRSRLAQFAARGLDHVIAISRYMQDAMRRMGIRESRLSLAYLGVDADALRASVTRGREEMRRELAVPEGAVLVVMVGNVREWKGQHVVLEALSRLAPSLRSLVQVRFVGAMTEGDTTYRDALDAKVAALDLGSAVRFLGGRDDVPSIYAAADISVHASVKPEPFGLVVPEAMVHGLAVIASKFGGPGEVLTPECGRTFDTAHPEELAAILTELVSDPALRQRLGAAAQRQVGTFSALAMAGAVTRVYDALLFPGAKRAGGDQRSAKRRELEDAEATAEATPWTREPRTDQPGS
jgi:glycosyltransferase involved in cell wall biosynthesis